MSPIIVVKMARRA